MTDDDHDQAAFRSFCEAGAAFLERALSFAKADDPELYADVAQLIQAGRVTPVLVTEFHPLRVNLRLLSTTDGRAVADVFTYAAREPAHH